MQKSISSIRVDMAMAADREHGAGGKVHVLIAAMAFLTVVDLFATQAILPTLAQHYQVSPAAMGLAVNASTIGMAVAGLVVALFARHIDRRTGVVVSLALLSVPTALLASASGLGSFAAMRILQGVFMATAFALTLAHLGEECEAANCSGWFAAYVTGNVASNLFGRLLSSALADHVGLVGSFYAFAALNLAGAVLAYRQLGTTRVPGHRRMPAIALTALGGRPLYAAFGIGFCILFAFIGTFTFVNFVLTRPPLSLNGMQLGLVYFVFLPSIFTTPLAGIASRHWDTRTIVWIGLAIAVAGAPLLVAAQLVAVLSGMILMGIGTFVAQAAATSFVNRAARGDRTAASGVYLCCYYLGGLAGSAVLGQVFDRSGWLACVIGIVAALMLAALLTLALRFDDR